MSETTFLNLPKEEQLKILDFWLDNGYVYSGNLKVINPDFNLDIPMSYTRPATIPSINWDHVDPKFNYLAVDRDGKGYLYSHKPAVFGMSWSDNNISGISSYVTVRGFLSYKEGTCHWKESLVNRPDYVEEYL